MTQNNSSHISDVTPPPALLLVLQKLKITYLDWYNYYQTLPKIHKYSLGQRIDNLFIGAIEFAATASFLKREEKLPFVRKTVVTIDVLKILLMILWETKSLDNKKYIALSIKIDEVGRMLGGWYGQLIKQNSPHIKQGEK